MTFLLLFLALVCCVLLWICHFPIGILGQMWYLIVPIPDICTLTYFAAIAWHKACNTSLHAVILVYVAIYILIID